MEPTPWKYFRTEIRLVGTKLKMKECHNTTEPMQRLVPLVAVPDFNDANNGHATRRWMLLFIVEQR